MTVYVTTVPVGHCPDGINRIVWPVGTEVTGPTGESLYRQGRARIKPGRKPAQAKPVAPVETKVEAPIETKDDDE